MFESTVVEKRKGSASWREFLALLSWSRQGDCASLVAGATTRQIGTEVIQTGMENPMLWTICFVLIVLWLLGFVTGTTMGGLIHVLLVIAIIVVLVRIISGRKPV